MTENDLKNKFIDYKTNNNNNDLNSNIIKQLKGVKLTPKKYLKYARFIAKNRGYNPNLLTISKDGIHKLNYDGVNFGRVGYNDKIIYTWLEHNNEIDEGTTKKKYTNYRNRAYTVMKKTNNKYSPASLSFYILW
jgi:hypothetical protein